MLIGLFGLT